MADESWREKDPYADQIYATKFDWRDELVMRKIRELIEKGIYPENLW